MTQVVKVRVASVISSDGKANDATWALGCAMGERPYLDITYHGLYKCHNVCSLKDIYLLYLFDSIKGALA